MVGLRSTRSTSAPTGEQPEVPTVTGVALADGTDLQFDWTVVATGRRDALPTWITALGAPAPAEEVDDSGIVYYSRFYRLHEGHALPPRTGPIGGDLGYVRYGVFPGDNGTFSLTLACATDDAVLRKLFGDEERFDRVGRALTFTRDYLDGRAEPITPVHKIAGLISRWRDYVVDGTPLAYGVVAIGDAALATNPLYGRGCTTGFLTAQAFATALRDHGATGPAAVAAGYDHEVRTTLKPWVTQTMQTDAEARRVATAILNGEDPDADTGDPRTFIRAVLRNGLRPALRTDPVVLRAFFRNFNLLAAPNSLTTEPDVGARVLAAYQDRDNRPPEPYLGPSRAELLAQFDAA